MRHSTRRSTVLLLAGFLLGLVWAGISVSLWPEETGRVAAPIVATAKSPASASSDVVPSLRPAITAPAPLAMEQTCAPDSRPPEMHADEQLARNARRDPAVLRNLVARYLSEGDETKREKLRSVLISVDAPEVLALAEQIVLNPDPTVRIEGLQLLQGPAGDSPQARRFLRSVLRSEQDAEAQSTAIGLLRPPQVRDAAEATDITAELQALSRNADASVRAQSLAMLGEWDRSAAVEEPLYQGLQDADPRVKEAALQAIAQSPVRSERVKTALLDTLKDPNATQDLRAAALGAISGFNLQRWEYDIVNKVLTQVVAAHAETMKSTHR